MSRSLHEFNTLTFDCYGTLIDWESGIWDALQPVLMANDCQTVNRLTGLELFAKVESAEEAENPALIYPEILKRVHIRLCRELDLKSSSELDEAFGQSVYQWPAFPDTADALRILKRHYKLVILSNVNCAGFTASNRKLGVAFDAIYTAEDVGSYKPNPANFEYMLERLNTDLNVCPETVLHTAQSLFHDHVCANEFGLCSAWIDRQGLADSENWGATAKVENRPELEFIFPTMMAMAEAVEASL